MDPEHAPGAVPADILERLAARVFDDTALWGTNLTGVPGFVATATRALCRLEEDGVDAAIANLDGA